MRRWTIFFSVSFLMLQHPALSFLSVTTTTTAAAAASNHSWRSPIAELSTANLSVNNSLRRMMIIISSSDTIPSSSFSFSSSRTRLYAKSGTKKKKPKDGTICVNRRARFQYEIIETLQAGISLQGTEVKSIRDGKMNLQDSYVKIDKNGRSASLMNCHIGKHTMSGAYFQHDERRIRPLLIHKSEARKWLQRTEQAGMTIVPLKAYFNEDNRIKLQLGLARGKNMRDKRAAIQERDAKRESSRIIKNFRI
ncbi:SsrA-binding protein [Nitzschia inconspicua]|uniref:SsrA-binding protein n=1 Tax=Nitzschia inconspicua TaxID=303405 RepID=A0A9K3LZ34_9STRA|nr:SsrA-binding protein [Nitzschia inconspicua]